jgi:hypothetical protein
MSCRRVLRSCAGVETTDPEPNHNAKHNHYATHGPSASSPRLSGTCVSIPVLKAKLRLHILIMEDYMFCYWCSSSLELAILYRLLKSTCSELIYCLILTNLHTENINSRQSPQLPTPHTATVYIQIRSIVTTNTISSLAISISREEASTTSIIVRRF